MNRATIVAAGPEAAATLTAIAFAAKRHWGYPEHWIKQWTQNLTVTADFVLMHPTFVAVERNEMVGFHALRISGADAILEHFWVRPTAMGRGIGRLLFTHGEAIGRAAGASRLKIESDPHAEGFYHRMGARTIGRKPAWMDGRERYLPVLEKSL